MQQAPPHHFPKHMFPEKLYIEIYIYILKKFKGVIECIDTIF